MLQLERRHEPTRGGKVWVLTAALLAAPGASAIVDLDGNWLSDVWELKYDRIGMDPAADPDGDGFTNRQECEGGTDPFNALSQPLPAVFAGDTNARKRRGERRLALPPERLREALRFEFWKTSKKSRRRWGLRIKK